MSTKNKAATLQDVARLAGVSGMTVSRALSKPDMVSERTRQKVEQAVRELGYVPNLAASQLVTRRSGIIGALIMVAAYFVGVALIGAGAGALVVNLIWASLGREPHIVIVIMFAIAGALAALALQRYVIIGATGFGGAWTAIVGGLALMGDKMAVEAAARNNVWLAYPMNPAPGERWVIVAWLALGIVGVITQLTVTSKGKK